MELQSEVQEGRKGRREKGKGELEMVKCVTIQKERLFRGRQGNSKVEEGWGRQWGGDE